MRSPAPSAGRDALTERVIGSAIEVHRELGPGLLESAYEGCLALELADAGLAVTRQVELPLRYKGRNLDAGSSLPLCLGEKTR